MMSCDQQNEMLPQEYSVPSSSLLTPPSSPGDPRSAYAESMMAALVENFTVNGLEEFVSYVFTITALTSEGSSPQESRCVMTEPSGK